MDKTEEIDENVQNAEKTLRLNAISAAILDGDDSNYAPFSTYPHIHRNSQRERKKVAKKERETTAAILHLKFLNKWS